MIGATGYTGEELLKILARHSKVQVTYVSAKESRSENIQERFPHLEGLIDLKLKELDPLKASEEADCFFLSLPHTVSMKVAPFLLSRGKQVVDLSADYRLHDKETFQKYYGVAHEDPANLKKAVYGLPELYRDLIPQAQLVANPGCYPTSILLGLLPFLKKKVAWKGTAVFDAKSGLTGAGRKTADSVRRSDPARENFKAYRVMAHQHSPELEQTLGESGLTNASFVFVPHLLPLERGILSTIYLKLDGGMKPEAFFEFYKKGIEGERFVRLKPLGSFPDLKDAHETNDCILGLQHDEKTGFSVIVSVIDNLVKGAAGQAVQNMNLMCGFAESEGL